MNTRLESVMSREQMSASRFAAALGVQPSAISHIMSGRNKPSYEFITRFMAAFPDYDIEWLLLGTGQMLKSSRNASSASSVSEAEARPQSAGEARRAESVRSDSHTECSPDASPASAHAPAAEMRLADAQPPRPSSPAADSCLTQGRPHVPVGMYVVWDDGSFTFSRYHQGFPV